jgi:hypothetical protein
VDAQTAFDAGVADATERSVGFEKGRMMGELDGRRDGFQDGYDNAPVLENYAAGLARGVTLGTQSAAIDIEARRSRDIGFGMLLAKDSGFDEGREEGFGEGFLLGTGAVVPAANPSGGGGVLTLTQSATSRYQKVTATVVLQATAKLYILMVVGDNIFGIYDPINGFIDAFKQESTSVDNGTSISLEILPNGGWWSRNFQLVFVGGKELT